MSPILVFLLIICNSVFSSPFCSKEYQTNKVLAATGELIGIKVEDFTTQIVAE